MILMSPWVPLGRTQEERAGFLSKVADLNVKTVTLSMLEGWPEVQPWTDREVHDARSFLDNHGIRVGEFSTFHAGFDSVDPSERKAAMEHYSRQLRLGRMLGAHCIGFSTYGDRGTPQMWSEETWQRSMDAITALAGEAEKAEMDIAAHPHVMSPLCSVDRHLDMLDRVGSPRLKLLMDIVNLTWPQMIFRTTEVTNEIFDLLGEHITALHAKDVIISGGFRVRLEKGFGVIHLDEAVPGTGHMDYATVLRRLEGLNRDITVNVEHFAYEDMMDGQEHIRGVARKVGVKLE